jgi:hypothetical protein
LRAAISEILNYYAPGNEHLFTCAIRRLHETHHDNASCPGPVRSCSNAAVQRRCAGTDRTSHGYDHHDNDFYTDHFYDGSASTGNDDHAGSHDQPHHDDNGYANDDDDNHAVNHRYADHDDHRYAGNDNGNGNHSDNDNDCDATNDNDCNAGADYDSADYDSDIHRTSQERRNRL